VTARDEIERDFEELRERERDAAREREREITEDDHTGPNSTKNTAPNRSTSTIILPPAIVEVWNVCLSNKLNWSL
jgi:hypothetical protein